MKSKYFSLFYFLGEGNGEPEERDTPSTPLDNCMPQISLATRTRDGSAYFANGKKLNLSIVAMYVVSFESEMSVVEPVQEATCLQWLLFSVYLEWPQ